MFGHGGFFGDAGKVNGADWERLKRGQKTMWMEKGGQTWWGSRTNDAFAIPAHLKPEQGAYKQAGGTAGGSGSGPCAGDSGAQSTARAPLPRKARRRTPPRPSPGRGAAGRCDP